jgi:hypothetical protein
VLLTTDASRYTEHDDWIGALGAVAVTRRAAWGALTERRLRLRSGLEIEVGIGSPSWASVDPVDEGTKRVVGDGLRVLYDPQGRLAGLQDCR